MSKAQRDQKQAIKLGIPAQPKAYLNKETMSNILERLKTERVSYKLKWKSITFWLSFFSYRGKDL